MYCTAVQCWEQGLYQYLSSKVQLEAGSDYAKPSTLSLMRAQDTSPGTNETLHGPSACSAALSELAISPPQLVKAR